MSLILPNPDIFPSVVGISHKDFRRLLPKFSRWLRRAERSRYVAETARVRDLGGGRKAALATDEQKLFFILFYYKVYPTYRLAEYLFGLDHTNCERWKEFLEGVLNQTLGYELILPKRKIKCLNELITICPALKNSIVDATERPIRRPADRLNENKYFSGKKNDHTIKNQILISPKTKRILYVSKTHEGKKHDKRLFEEDPIWMKTPPNTTILSDGGYTGIDKLSPYIKNPHSFKREAGKDLTTSQNEFNKAVSSFRSGVANTFAYLKHFNILRHDFRNNLQRAQLPFETIAAIYNFTR